MLSCFSCLLEITRWRVESWLRNNSSVELNSGGSDKCVDEWQRLEGIFPAAWHNQTRIIRQIYLPRTVLIFAYLNATPTDPTDFDPRLTSSASFLAIAGKFPCRNFRVGCKKSIADWNICVESEMNIWMLDFKAASERCNQIHLTGCLFDRCQPMCKFNLWS